MSVAAVILNGGKSSRMGQDKSLLKVDGETLIQRAQNLLKLAGLKSIYTSGPGGIDDELPNAGPLSGLYSSLNALKNYDFVLFIPVDMPLMNRDLIQKLLKENEHDLVHIKDQHFPMMIRNKGMIRSLIHRQLNLGNLAIHQLIKTVGAKALNNQWGQEPFFNANSPEQWHEILKIFED